MTVCLKLSRREALAVLGAAACNVVWSQKRPEICIGAASRANEQTIPLDLYLARIEKMVSISGDKELASGAYQVFPRLAVYAETGQYLFHSSKRSEIAKLRSNPVQFLSGLIPDGRRMTLDELFALLGLRRASDASSPQSKYVFVEYKLADCKACSVPEVPLRSILCDAGVSYSLYTLRIE